MAALFWDARRGRLPTQDASRLTFILSSIARVIEGSSLEQRMAELEGPSTARLRGARR